MEKRKYNHLFFDLDHTIWDFDSNSIDTLVELFDSYHLERFFLDFETFHKHYEHQNSQLWNHYRQSKIKKGELNLNRFSRPLEEAGCNDGELAKKLASEYLNICSTKTALLPYAANILEYLKQKKYKLYIVSNGFSEVQHRKIELSGIRHFFDKIYISDIVGIHKPGKDFFDYIVKSSNARKNECLVIGDSMEADIEGALNAGLDAIFYNSRAMVHDNKEVIEIKSLLQLKDYL